MPKHLSATGYEKNTIPRPDLSGALFSLVQENAVAKKSGSGGQIQAPKHKLGRKNLNN